MQYRAVVKIGGVTVEKLPWRSRLAVTRADFREYVAKRGTAGDLLRYAYETAGT